ncbi:hypothetical protein PCANC_24166 [Puccinia coronata f. sp. avenae]|uniref:Uncharacterized protein n=1 Tax=Puccinia coronata f. sp. avenae TaxID=200324 RepID=A0A2N5S532_9BASI|nr:hypothetical protein PCANC_24166 [Puccinia coronata f. sp. avenae]
MDASSVGSSSSRRSSSGSLPALARRLSGGSAKTVRWIGRKLQNRRKDDDSDSDELWGTSIERPADLEDPNCPIDSVPSGYIPLHQLTPRARPEALHKHWHSPSSLSQATKKVAKKSGKPDLKTLFKPPTEEEVTARRGLQRAHSLDRRSKTPVDHAYSRPQSRLDQLKSSARTNSPSRTPSSSSTLASSPQVQWAPRDNTPGSSATWSQSQTRKKQRGPAFSRLQEMYEPPK